MKALMLVRNWMTQNVIMADINDSMADAVRKLLEVNRAVRGDLASGHRAGFLRPQWTLHIALPSFPPLL